MDFRPKIATYVQTRPRNTSVTDEKGNKGVFFCLTPPLAVENASKCGICEGTSLNEASPITAVLMSANARVDDSRRSV